MQPLKLMLETLLRNGLGGYIINTSDNHLNEYISDSDKKVEFVTGFTGSNGIAVITNMKNVLFTDSRYFIQAERELRQGFKLMKMGKDIKLAEFLVENCKLKTVGIDRRLISHEKFKDLEEKLDKKAKKLIHKDISIFNEFWPNLKPRAFKPIIDLETITLKSLFLQKEDSSQLKESGKNENYAKYVKISELLLNSENVTGSFRKKKISEIRRKLKKDQGLIITEMDSIAWLFNLRGNDIDYNPLFFSYAYITATNAILFIGTKLKIEGIEIRPYSEFESFISDLKNEILISNSCNALITKKLRNYSFVDFVVEKKGIKNEVEIEGFKLAHLLDGLALSVLFEWLLNSVRNGENILEMEVAEKLIEIKKEIGGYKSESFKAICGFGPNSAIVHYTSNDSTLEPNNVFLLDSGSQYFYGTTDVTRTIHLSEPTEEQKNIFTKVLKGNLISKDLIWPKNLDSSFMTNLARIYFWEDYSDYGHGTSHGVGHFLNVHEAPPEFKSSYNLKDGQVMSIEPGFYIENKFGVRIEDLVVVRKTDNSDYLKFEALTCVPLQLKMIDTSILTDNEILSINNYSKWVRDTFEPILKNKDGYNFLMENTIEIKK